MLPMLALLLLASAPHKPRVVEEPPPPPPPPTPECISSRGRTVCGFQCKTSASDLDCAQTPYGTCEVTNGGVYCWDPPRVVIHHPPRTPVSPECKSVRGKVACGFNCRLSNGEVACNNTPYGVCTTHFGKLVCWDPPESVIHEYAEATPRPWCVNASEDIACGFDCKSTRTEARCASTPRGVCKLVDQQFTCFDPPSLLHCVHGGPPEPARARAR